MIDVISILINLPNHNYNLIDHNLINLPNHTLPFHCESDCQLNQPNVLNHVSRIHSLGKLAFGTFDRINQARSLDA